MSYTAEQERIRKGERDLATGKMLTAPRWLPYRWLAKSCTTCGLLLTTPDDRLRWTAPRVLCPVCTRAIKRRSEHRRRQADPAAARAKEAARMRAYLPARMARDESFRRAQVRRRVAQQARWNSTLRDAAHRHRQEWTGPELELVARPDLSARQVAQMLGRTLYAVRTQRHKLAAGDPRTVRLANLP